MTEECRVIKLVPISQLTLLEKNPRKITKEQMDKLCKSIKDDPDFLFSRPVLVNHIVDSNKMVVYAGNQRIRAAKKLNWITIPCIVEENLPEDIIKDRIVKDNVTYGEFDYDILANEYDINDLIDAGLTEKELGVVLDSMKDIAEDIESDEKEEDEPKSNMCPSCGYEY